MVKLAIYFFLFFGFVFLLLFPPLGLLLLVIGFFIVLIAILNRKADILDNWSILIKDAKGQRDAVISTTRGLITSSNAPSIEMRDEKVGSGLTTITFGETRDFLIVSDRRSLKLSNFKTFVNANDYGNHLFVSWYLTYKPDFWQALLMLLPGVRKVLSLDELDLFNKQDLTAYSTNVHHCLLAAVDKLMLNLNQDPSKIDRKSRGFLGIS